MINSNASDYDLECALWADTSVSAWSDSITGGETIFNWLYGATVNKVLKALKEGFDCVLRGGLRLWEWRDHW